MKRILSLAGAIAIASISLVIVVLGAALLPLVSSGKAAAARGEFIRAVIRARRQAVDYMYANPDEAAEIIAKAYTLSPDVAKSAVKNLLGSHEKSGVRYWSGGEIDLKAMNEMMRAQKIVGALKDDPDWSKIIDESFLPDDLKKKTN